MNNFLLKLGKIMSDTDPSRIYVENVRSFLSVTTSLAKLLCEMAVRENYFEKEIGYICPNCSRIICSSTSIATNDKASCLVCQNNEESSFEFNVSDLKKIEYYKLVSI